MDQSILTNETARNYEFLKTMSSDSFYPSSLVDKGKDILIEVCYQIEQDRPRDLEGFYKLSLSATSKFNILADEFAANGSEFETMAAESVAIDMVFIAETYGYDADVERMIGNRHW